MPSSREFSITNLAAALLGGVWSKRAVLDRARQACDIPLPLLRSIVRWILTNSPTSPPDFATLVRDLGRAYDRLGQVPAVGRLFWSPPAMNPRCDVPALATTAQLADWLGVDLARLDWLADLKGLNCRPRSAKLRHYTYRWIQKRGGRQRLLEAPKATLKEIQRTILRNVLEKIPVHDAVHGFRRGRSIGTYVTPHVGRDIVLRFDIRDFFPSVSAARVGAIFRWCGYPPRVAKMLAGLCTTRTPDDIWGDRPRPPRWQSSHLPQGAPTSPTLANLAARRLDVRLAALAARLGACYTRYADDIALSGDRSLARNARRVQIVVAVIAGEEGFELNLKKSRFMRRGVRQQLAGIVLNEKPNLPRERFDELKAILFNCVRHGPAGQNRAGHADFRSHLLGKIAYFGQFHPARAAKLMALFEQIRWADHSSSSSS